MTIFKSAVDAEAKRYWSDYYADTGYGAQWVRDIPMRVKAELHKASGLESGVKALKTASIEPEIRPLSTLVTPDGVVLEGMAIYASENGEALKVRAFIIDFDHNGNPTGFDCIDAV